MSAPSPKCDHYDRGQEHHVPFDKNNPEGRCCCWCYENWVKDHHRIPKYTMDALTRWIEQGIEPGGFLMQVLMNRSFSIVAGRADELNALNLVKLYRYLLNHCPEECWGSEEKVLTWKEKKQFEFTHREEKESL